MAKHDFCFTYYDGDATRDMSHMNRLERGAYNDLVISQRKFGRLTMLIIKKTLGEDFEKVWDSLELVLVKEEDNYFIEWLENSEIKMKKQASHQSINGSKGGRPKSQTKPELNPNETQTHYKKKPLGNEIENGNVIETENKERGLQGETVLWTETVKNFKNDFRWKEKFCRDKNIPLPQLENKMLEFLVNIELKEDFKTLKELKNHFTNTFNKITNGSNTQGTGKIIIREKSQTGFIAP